MSNSPCPKCNCEYVYPDRDLLVCPECAYEWDPLVPLVAEDTFSIKDVNGNVLAEGDKLTIIKDLKVKGSSLVLKIGSKAVIKRIVDAKDHQLDCKVEGIGEMVVTAKFVKKA